MHVYINIAFFISLAMPFYALPRDHLPTGWSEIDSIKLVVSIHSFNASNQQTEGEVVNAQLEFYQSVEALSSLSKIQPLQQSNHFSLLNVYTLSIKPSVNYQANSL